MLFYYASQMPSHGLFEHLVKAYDEVFETKIVILMMNSELKLLNELKNDNQDISS